MFKTPILLVAVTLVCVLVCCAFRDAASIVGNVRGAICSKCGHPTGIERYEFKFRCRNCRHVQWVKELVPPVAPAYVETDPPTQ